MTALETIYGSAKSSLDRRALLVGAGALAIAASPALAAGNRFIHASPRTKRPVLIRGGRLLTMDPANSGSPQADILISGEVIEAVGPSIHMPDAEIIEAEKMIVMPGFVDGHRHLWEGLIRGALPTEDLAGYIDKVNKQFARAYEPEDVYLGTLISALGALDSGVTAVLDWAHINSTPDHTSAALSALKEAGIRAVFAFGKGPTNQPPGYWPDALKALQKQEFATKDQLLTLGLATTSPEFVPYELARAHIALAREASVLVTMHAGLRGIGKPGAIEDFGKEGLLGPDVNLVHCNTLSDEEWRIIADTGTSVTITPSVEMQMGHGMPPVQKARNAGVLPALGVDVETSAPADMWTQMRTIYAYQRINAYEASVPDNNGPDLITPAQALTYATTAGARAALLGDKIGALKPGMQADLLLLRTDAVHSMPSPDPESAVLLNMDARNIDSVFVAGQAIKRKGKLLGADIARLAERISLRRQALIERLPANP